MTKAIAYARVAGNGRFADLGIALQVYQIREFADRAGLEIITEITDIQSVTRSVCHGLTRLRALLDAGAAEAVIVTSLDRLSRKPVDVLALLR
jgi:DNA invertase Pin-like site-specific DNA recombinase